MAFRKAKLTSSFFILPIPSDNAIKAGKVPKPKKSMILAPVKLLPLASAQVRVEYTKPQGNQPHKAPKARAFLRLSTGITCLAIGDK